jgi:lysophospholipase L1-like esterase
MTEPAVRQFTVRRSLFLASVLVVGVLALAEGALRVVGVRRPERARILLRSRDVDIDFPFMRPDRELFWSLRPGYEGEFLGQPVHINGWGLRGPEPRQPKPAGLRRLLCFGDSVTFGFGVADVDTYASRLDAELRPRGLEVVNAGVTGYTSHQVLGLLRRLAPTFAADMATFCVGWNDASRRPLDDREFEERLQASMAVDRLFEHLYLYRGMKALYVSAATRDVPMTEYKPRVDLEQYQANLAAIVEECRRHAIRPLFVELPRRRRAGEARAASPYADALAETGRRLGVPVLSVGDLGLGTTLDSNEASFIDTLHLSPAGHQKMAGELARQLLAGALR